MNTLTAPLRKPACLMALMAWMALWALGCSGAAFAAEAPERPALARLFGADERGMRKYVLVVLKTGPNRVAPGPERDEMFKGHFANIERLANEGKLVLAGPFDGADGWRGLFVFAVTDVEEARRLVATDPVIAKGEMVAEYHRYYGTAALTLVNELHRRLVGRQP
jgi:uncharacterized protein YciI